MHHDSRNLWQNLRDRSTQCSRRRQQILVPTEIANHIHHTQLPHASAALKITTVSTTINITATATVLRQTAVPNADEVIVGEFESSQGVGDSCGQRQQPQRWLAETEIRNVMRKQAHCHTKAKRDEERLSERRGGRQNPATAEDRRNGRRWRR